MRPLLVLAALLSADNAQARLCSLDLENAPRRLVTCRDNVTMKACRKLAEAAGCSVVRELPSIKAVVITVEDGTVPEVEAKLSARPEVESVEEDKRVNWLRSVLPVEEAREIVRGFTPSASPAASELPWGVTRVNAPAAWARANGRGAKIAIIDTGIDASHPDLAAVVAGGVNVADPKKPTDFRDDQGHGTHVAGTAAAARDGRGVAGVAPGAKLYGVKVLDAEGNGTYSEIIAGIEWAVANKMDVANMSLGASEGTAALRKAVVNAARAGLVIVAAAGNDSGGPISFPGAYPEVLTVSSSDKADRLSDFSSVGEAVDFIAPGSDILSSVPGGGYAEHSGTSMAAPHVAGLCALAVSQGKRGLSSVKSALQSAASFLPELTSTQQGKGMVDAARIGGAPPLAVAGAR